MKRKIIWTRVWMAMSGGLLVLTPLFVILVNQTREVASIGGEAVIWMFPMMFAALAYANEQDRKER